MEFDVNSQKLIDALPEATLLLTPDGVIAAANRSALELLQRESAELIGADLASFLDDSAHRFRNYLARCSRNGSFCVELFTFSRGNDEPVACRCDGAFLAGGSAPLLLLRQTPRTEAISCFVALNEQISALNEARHGLDNQVRSRTEDLIEARGLLRDLSVKLMQAQDDERRRLARELHDSTSQILTAIQLNLSLATAARKLDPAVRDRLDEAIDLTNQVIGEIRALSHLLHPPLLDEAGLGLALQNFVEGFEERSGICVQLDVAEEFDRLEQDLETGVFRIIQECLTNIHRHSGSKTALVELQSDRDVLRLDVRDMGCGMEFGPDGKSDEKSANLKAGVGLRGMQERVRLLGGSIDFLQANPGTLVRVKLPFVARAQSLFEQALSPETATEERNVVDAH
jgi:signal transduction histidine kinase